MRDRYLSTGPYLVTYEYDDGHTEWWNCPRLSSAIAGFWQDASPFPPSQPERRTIVDVNGVVICVEIDRRPTAYAFSVTREVWSATVASCQHDPRVASALNQMEALSG